MGDPDYMKNEYPLSIAIIRKKKHELLETSKQDKKKAQTAFMEFMNDNAWHIAEMLESGLLEVLEALLPQECP